MSDFHTAIQPASDFWERSKMSVLRRVFWGIIVLIAAGGVLLWAIGAYRNVSYTPGGAHITPPAPLTYRIDAPGANRAYGAGCGTCPYHPQEDDPEMMRAMDQCLTDHLSCWYERKEDGSLEVLGRG